MIQVGVLLRIWSLEGGGWTQLEVIQRGCHGPDRRAIILIKGGSQWVLQEGAWE